MELLTLEVLGSRPLVSSAAFFYVSITGIVSRKGCYVQRQPSPQGGSFARVQQVS